MINVFIVDDHFVVREGLKRVLGESDDIRVVGEASSAEEALRMLPRCPCEVVVTDLAMPGRGGLALVGEIRKLGLPARVLVLSIHAEGQLVVRALREGAAGYLTKDSTPTELVRAVRKVAAGGRYVTEALAEVLTERLAGEAAGVPHDLLSRREYEVLVLLGEGKPVSAIAVELSLNVKTVSTYRSRILEKMKMKTTGELIAYAVREGLTLRPSSGV